MTLNGLLQKSPASLPILQATFGLERESLRISKINHRVAQTKHPENFGESLISPLHSDGLQRATDRVNHSDCQLN